MLETRGSMLINRYRLPRSPQAIFAMFSACAIPCSGVDFVTMLAFPRLRRDHAQK